MFEQCLHYKVTCLYHSEANLAALLLHAAPCLPATTATSTMASEDLLDHTTRFLAKREGIDKTLKLLRYTSRLALAVGVADPELRYRLTTFEASIGKRRNILRLHSAACHRNPFCLPVWLGMSCMLSSTVRKDTFVVDSSAQRWHNLNIN